MVAEWETVTVRELVDQGVLERPIDGNHGEIHPKASDFVESGIPFIMASDLVDGRVDTKGCAFITERQARSLRKGFAVSGDVLISHKATMGRTAIVEELGVPFLMLTPQVTYYRVKDPTRLSDRYLKFYFDSPGFQRLFETWGHKGSTRAYLGITAQLDLPIVLPPMAEQRAIAYILGTLDDNIELNRRMSETLEAMARALFKSWFVDFDPVRAKAEGRDPGLPQPLADLFPSRLVDSELGEIPVGWTVERFGNVVEQLRDNESPLASPDVQFRHFSIPAFDDGQWPRTELGASIKSQKSRVPPGAVLLSKLNPEIERVWLADVEANDRAVCSTEFLVLDPRPPYGRSYAYCVMRSPEFRRQLESLVTGTSKSHQRAHAAAILGLGVVKAKDPLPEQFERMAAPLLERSLECRRESRTLAALRDTLLPKLVSGEIRVNGAARAAAEGL
jgi:type I restriction enzyme S subunit